MATSVAVEGDVTATPGTVLSTKTAAGSGSSAPAGTWTAGPVSYTSYSTLKAGGVKVIWKAECTFSFSGTNTSGTAVTDEEKVTLTASTKLLQKGQNNVLVNGDTKASPVYQNTLRASTTGKLKTA
jgi:hypothetical protein